MAVQHAQVTVGVAATALNVGAKADNMVGKSIVARNRGTASVFLGDATVTTGTGFELGVGESVTLDLADGEVVYGIAAANQRVDVLRTGI